MNGGKKKKKVARWILIAGQEIFNIFLVFPIKKKFFCNPSSFPFFPLFLFLFLFLLSLSLSLSLFLFPLSSTPALSVSSRKERKRQKSSCLLTVGHSLSTLTFPFL